MLGVGVRWMRIGVGGEDVSSHPQHIKPQRARLVPRCEHSPEIFATCKEDELVCVDDTTLHLETHVGEVLTDSKQTRRSDENACDALNVPSVAPQLHARA